MTWKRKLIELSKNNWAVRSSTSKPPANFSFEPVTPAEVGPIPVVHPPPVVAAPQEETMQAASVVAHETPLDKVAIEPNNSMFVTNLKRKSPPIPGTWILSFK